ncbi:MAG: YtxH domain-containing protein [Flavobacteriales bacterium]|nr:YtxH domain-containing protein [Flavobacteriales bacterium]
MSNERTNGILGFLAGAAIGATLGVLFAPSSGKRNPRADRQESRRCERRGG